MFGLAALEDAQLALAADALTACGRPVPARRLKYHSDVAVQCCDGDGLLTVHWNPITPDRTGIPQGMGNPPGVRKADIHLRLYRCFPVLRDDGSYPEDEGDDAAEGLAIDADCLLSAMLAAICSGSLSAYLAGCDGLEWLDLTPRRPAGGCAGIDLRTRAAWKPWAADPEPP